MLINFFMTIRRYEVPATIRELVDLIEALRQRTVYANLDRFYLLARTCLVKDERHYDKFDKAFGVYFKGLENLQGILETLIPDEWLRRDFLNSLSQRDLAQLQSLGGLEALVEAFRELQEPRRDGKAGEENGGGEGEREGRGGRGPKGRDGQGGRKKKDKKSWMQRQYKNLDDSVELGTRNMKIALRRLRKFARTGKEDEFDVDSTIRSTAHNGGLLDIRMRPERKNVVKVLTFFDIGGSMDAHVRICEELFSAARTEFKHMASFYFHNCPYEAVWKDDKRRMAERVPTMQILRKYPPDYRVVFVGDATMAPYEITHPGGSVEHWNEEPGAIWMQRICAVYNKVIWLNPTPEDAWQYSSSSTMIAELLGGRMYPLTIAGLESSMSYLSK